jgi:iron complex outermembrane receptor protein
MQKENLNFISNYVLDYINFKLVGNIQQKINNTIFFDLRIVYQDREGSFTQYLNGMFGEEIDYNPFFLLDGKITYSQNKFKFFAGINNILNTNYFDIGNVVQPGRWWKTGISYRFNFDKDRPAE